GFVLLLFGDRTGAVEANLTRAGGDRRRRLARTGGDRRRALARDRIARPDQRRAEAVGIARIGDRGLEQRRGRRLSLPASHVCKRQRVRSERGDQTLVTRTRQKRSPWHNASRRRSRARWRLPEANESRRPAARPQPGG